MKRKSTKSLKPRWATRNQIAFTLSGMCTTLNKIPQEMIYQSESFLRSDTVRDLQELIRQLRVRK